MIGSSFLNSRSCNSDVAFTKEFPSLDSVAFDFDSLGDILDATDSNGKLEEQSSVYSGSPVYSSASEDCDFAELSDDIRSILPLDLSTSKFLEEDSSLDLLDLDSLNWVSLSENLNDSESATNSTNEVVLNSTQSPRKKRNHEKSPKHVSNSKSWSRMSTKERLRIAHALSQIISKGMDFTQQLEVIKLIDPTAVLSPNATEVSISLSHLNDANLKRVCQYLSDYTNCLIDVNSLMNSSKVKSSSASNCHRAKRRPKKFDNPPYIEKLTLREKKVMRQGKKEKRSGLFIMEKVIKKLHDPQEEEEDVNILE